ncbi:MAG: tetratricopeptide repeat protein [Candidatus Sericytochromatia bacterium]|nr:tetratricopeptide repeat protein [Candidatus Sericytochromatia bacterium]
MKKFFLLSLLITSTVFGYSLTQDNFAYAKTIKSNQSEKNIQKPDNGDEANLTGQQYFEKGKEAYLKYSNFSYKEAISYFEKSLKFNRKDAVTLAYKAQAEALLSRVIYQPKGGVVRATLELKAYESAYISGDLDPDLSEVHRALSMVYFVQERYDEGKEEAKKAIKINDKDAESYLLLWLNSPDKEMLKLSTSTINYYYRSLDVESENISKALELNPNLVLTYIQLGVANANQTKYFESKDNYNKVLKLNPQSEEAYTYLGFLHNSASHYDEAINSFEQALEIDPQRSDATYGIGVSYLKKRDKISAITYFKNACDANYRDACDVERNLRTDSRGGGGRN